MKKIIFITLGIFAFVAGVTLTLYYTVFNQKGTFLESVIVPIVIEIIVSIIISTSVMFKNGLVNFVLSKKGYKYDTKYNNEKIRLSFAYLIRIRVNNKYLLVMSGHNRNIYGPVGGVYHIEHDDYAYNKLGFSRDSTPGDPDDVRGNIKGKKIKKFIKWFEKEINRETTPHREYDEELIKSGCLPKELFGNPNFKYIATKYKNGGIFYDEYYKINTLIRFDIYEYVLSKEQIKYLEKTKLDKRLKLFYRNEIETCGVTNDNDKVTIGTQAPYILED